MSGLITTAPWAPCVTVATDRISPSGSLSFARTGTSTEPSSFSVAVSSKATGGRLAAAASIQAYTGMGGVMPLRSALIQVPGGACSRPSPALTAPELSSGIEPSKIPVSSPVSVAWRYSKSPAADCKRRVRLSTAFGSVKLCHSIRTYARAP